MSENNSTPVLKNTDAVVNAVRYAVKSRGTWATFVKENSITRDMIADTARALAVLAYPNDKPVQKTDGTRTRFGNAVQAAGNGMRSVLDKDESGDDTGTVNLLTKDGVSTLAELDDAALLAAIRAELSTRAK